jgi:hypothetical protein
LPGANVRYDSAMTIFSKRNALVGSVALYVGRKVAKRKLRGVTSRLRTR